MQPIEPAPLVEAADTENRITQQPERLLAFCVFVVAIMLCYAGIYAYVDLKRTGRRAFGLQRLATTDEDEDNGFELASTVNPIFEDDALPKPQQGFGSSYQKAFQFDSDDDDDSEYAGEF